MKKILFYIAIFTVFNNYTFENIKNLFGSTNQKDLIKITRNSSLQSYAIATIAVLIASFSAHTIKQIYKDSKATSTIISALSGISLLNITFKSFNNKPNADEILVAYMTGLLANMFIWNKYINHIYIKANINLNDEPKAKNQ